MDLEAIKPKIAEIAEKYGLSAIVLFGSQATGKTHGKSDVDIAVLSKNDFDRFALATDLDKAFNRDDVEVVDLRAASPTLMYVVVRDGVLLYESEKDSFFSWKMYAIRVWLDTAWLRKLADKKLVDWANQK
ncbi:MAG: nucleotidyltransferase domain-containing protein [Candidatus Taylorbacteria bacterium]|nr:nucleotidyltransferase domain-containing protein [Candidatus Taylorbacteria bacterium]